MRSLPACRSNGICCPTTSMVPALALLTIAGVVAAPASTEADADVFVAAAARGDLARLKVMLEGGANVNAINKYGTSGLFVASHNGRKEVVAFLLAKGADINSRLKDGRTPLMAAAENGSTHVLEILLAKGAELERRSDKGWSALMHAAAFSRDRAIEVLLKHGADANACNNEGETPLMRIAKFGNKRAMRALLTAKGVDVGARAKDGKTALMIASERCQWNRQAAEMVTLLINAGAVDSIVTATVRGDVGVVEGFLKGGVSVETRDPRGKTLLMLAANGGRTEVVALLIAEGAQVNARDGEGKTPLMYAVEGRGPQLCLDTVKALLLHGADVTVADNEGRTAYRLARDPGARRLLAKAIIASAKATREQAASAYLTLGNGAEHTMESIETYKKVISDYKGTSAHPKAIFNLGTTYKQLRDYDRAIEAYEMMFAIDVNDLEPGGHIMETYRNYRPRAQWEIANCNFSKGEYAEALKAYRKTEERYPFRSWCGNEQAMYRFRYAFYQGVCHENLGHPGLAIKFYFRAILAGWGFYNDPRAHMRIVDLYQSLDKEEELARLLDEFDAWFTQNLRNEVGNTLGPRGEERLMISLPSGPMRTLIKLREVADRGDFDHLVEVLRSRRSSMGAVSASNRRKEWEADEAARLLAKHPARTAALLINELETRQGANNKWVFYALGLCRTEEALAALLHRAEREENCWLLDSLLHAISLSGDRGAKVIHKLTTTATPPAKVVITNYTRRAERTNEQDVLYPPVPKDANVPSKFAEIEGMLHRRR